ncbi:dipeptidase [Pseudomonas putida]|uniref:dipeptidase n=1 Tax=Pseudomonas putida TaxID=303 RepID=UPI0009A1DE9C|nr:membrane dipeptidase [Pseudomonas putida]
MSFEENRRELSALTGGGIIWDNHVCMPLRTRDDGYLCKLEHCRDAGVDVVTLPIGYGNDSVEQHFRMISLFRDWIARNSNSFRLVLTVEDVLAAKRSGQLGICFDIEGMGAVADQPDLVRLYYDLGVRWMLIAYNRSNSAGGGCLDNDCGLTEYGRQIIKVMNEVGMVLCCTHAGYLTARQAIEVSDAPVIFSHSNPRSMYDHPRNIPDDLMRMCAERGGVIGLNGIGIFLGNNDASTETFMRHLEYSLDLVGEDHVGIGTDYSFDQEDVQRAVLSNPETFPPELFPSGSGLEMIPPWRFNEIAFRLSDRGYSQSLLAKLFGGNHMRIANQVWR